MCGPEFVRERELSQGVSAWLTLRRIVVHDECATIANATEIDILVAMPESLVDRARKEAALIASGTNLAQRATPAILGFDTTTMPVKLKYSPRKRDPKSVVLLTVHVTDVEGGFSVARYLIAKWRRFLELGKVPRDLTTQLPDVADLGGSSYLLGLLERYSGLAYHRVASRRAGNVRNHPL